MSDCMYSRDLQTEIEELQELQQEEELTSYSQMHLDNLLMLKKETEDSGWEYGILFINENYFEEYAQEFAIDIGAISSDAPWPTYCIDWEQAARELAMDYMDTSFEGESYYYREA